MANPKATRLASCIFSFILLPIAIVLSGCAYAALEEHVPLPMVPLSTWFVSVLEGGWQAGYMNIFAVWLIAYAAFGVLGWVLTGTMDANARFHSNFGYRMDRKMEREHQA